MLVKLHMLVFNALTLKAGRGFEQFVFLDWEHRYLAGYVAALEDLRLLLNLYSCQLGIQLFHHTSRLVS